MNSLLKRSLNQRLWGGRRERRGEEGEKGGRELIFILSYQDHSPKVPELVLYIVPMTAMSRKPKPFKLW